MKKIVVAMDSMKGCLSSLDASRSVAVGVMADFPEAYVRYLPVADGGEGTSEALAYESNGYKKICTKVCGPLGEKVSAEWYYDRCGEVAVIDMASAAGITLIEEDDRDPINATTYGVGELIMKAVSLGAKYIYLGLGGSATVDGGMGALMALGKNASSMALLGDRDFHTIALEGVELVLLCDVDAPFTGERGAARVFGPQKGASEDEVEILEERLEKIRKMALDSKGIDLNQVPGSGAAGGLAGGLVAFAGAKIMPGAATILDLKNFDRELEDSDLIITGEGRSDAQTLMGKLPYEILRRGMRKGIPVWLVAGRVSDEDALLEAGFERVICINSPDIVERSETIGKDPMAPEIAARRLSSIVDYTLDA